MPLPQPHSVCVFAASSNDVSEAYRDLARQLGTAVAQQGWRLVYGGGKAGLMGEVSKAALDAGGLVTGIIPRSMHTRERVFTDIDDLVEVDTMAQRKILMDQRSSAFAVLPGGVGTLDELTDVLTTRHLGFHQRPLVLVDPDGFWEPLTALFNHMVTARLMPAESLQLVTTAHSVAAAITDLGVTQ
ncbi:MAG: TIGR00730 family Rossman fold protein [Euzebya sp.]